MPPTTTTGDNAIRVDGFEFPIDPFGSIVCPRCSKPICRDDELIPLKVTMAAARSHLSNHRRSPKSAAQLLGASTR